MMWRSGFLRTLLRPVAGILGRTPARRRDGRRTHVGVDVAGGENYTTIYSTVIPSLRGRPALWGHRRYDYTPAILPLIGYAMAARYERDLEHALIFGERYRDAEGRPIDPNTIRGSDEYARIFSPTDPPTERPDRDR